MAEEQIILIKKKAGHGGHHGGAWKVAYADFVTAMMALFIVLWLMNTSKPTQEAIGGYFRDPKGTADKKGLHSLDVGTPGAAKKEEEMAKLRHDLIKAMEKNANFEKLRDQIEITLTPEGLRIELLENPKGTFFENGKSQPTPVLTEILKVLSAETGKLPNPISIEGHTDAKPYASPEEYSNWELSTDRANMARRLMEASGIRPGQLVQVRGYADRNLRKPHQPFDASNRRISIIVQYPGYPGSQNSTAFNGSGPIPLSDMPAMTATSAGDAKSAVGKTSEAAAATAGEK